MSDIMDTKTVVVVTEKGKIIKFLASEIPRQIRGGIGIRAITVKEDDKVVSAFVIQD